MTHPLDEQISTTDRQAAGPCRPHVARAMAVGGALALAASLAACGNSEKSASTTTAATSTTTAEGSTSTTAAEGSTTTSAEGESTTTTAAASGSGSGTETVASAVTAAKAYLASLDDSQRTETQFAADDVDGMKSSWSNLPAPLFDARRGIKFGDLTADQRAKALAVVKAVTSEQGYTQVEGIMAADDYLGKNSTGSGPGGQALEWTSDAYRLAIYGEPNADGMWLVQFGGHHLAMHLAISGGKVTGSPEFTGVEPLSFTYDGKDYAPMVAESKAVFGLIGTFTDAQKTSAKLAGTFDGVLVGPGADDAYPTQEGIAYSELTADQQAMVKEIIKLWVGDMPASTSDALIAEYEKQLADTKIGWSGGTDEATQNSYLRIDGPRLWIEFSVVPAIGSGKPHFHTIYRDKTLDYGQAK